MPSTSSFQDTLRIESVFRIAGQIAGRSASFSAALAAAFMSGVAPALAAEPSERPAASAPQAIGFSTDDNYPRERWIYGQGARPAGAAGAVSALIEAKRTEVENRYGACGPAATRARAMAKALSPWIDALELRCALAASLEAERGGVSHAAALERALEGVDRRADELAQGPHAAALRPLYAQAALVAFDLESKSDRARAWTAFDRVERVRPWLDDKQRARGLKLAGELAFIQQRLEAARAFFRRSLEAQPDQADVRSRVQALEATLLRTGRGGGTAGAGTAGAGKAAKPGADEAVDAADAEAPAVAGKLEGNPRLEPTARESELVDRATAALKRGDLVPAADDLAAILRDFPGGSRAKWAADRLQETYLTVAEREDGARAQIRGQIAKRMLEADADRRIDWARNLNARGFYDDGLKIAQSAAEASRGSAREGRALEAVVAAALSSEKWRDARDAARALVERHAGTPGGREGLLRAAQADYHLKEYGVAAAQLERLLAIPQSDNLELVARHLLWRALQKTNSPRAGEARDQLIARFPFSYYGLRARLDRDGALDVANWAGGVAPAPAKSKPTKLAEEEWFSGAARAAYERATLLLRAGWLEEAAAELRELPVPSGAKAKALRSRLHAAALDYPTASRLVNDAWDADPSLRREPFLRVGFPLEFIPSIEKEAKARGLEKWLAIGLIKQESAFNPRAQSTSNARGLMQMIPPTAREIAEDLNIKDLEIPRDLERPPLNVRMGAYYLAKVLRKYQGYVPLALASYNAGPGRVDRWLRARPSLANLSQTRTSNPDDELWFDEMPWSETCFYVKAILRNVLIYRALDQGRVATSDPLWLSPQASAASPTTAEGAKSAH